jgi:F-type H+-transporting ATPase subunit epsilon
MADGLNVEIVSPEKLVLSETANAVSVPGREGYFTVMGDHAPMMTTLKPGFVTVSGASGDDRTFYVRGGFADVSSAGLTVLAEEAKTASDFDRTEIEAAIKAAQDALSGAENADDKSAAQAVLDGWMNLMMEAGTMGDTVQL